MAARMTATALINCMRSRGMLDSLLRTGTASPPPIIWGMGDNDLATLRPNPLSVGLTVQPHASEDATAWLVTWLHSRFLGDGPKVFRPSARQCEALENVELNLPLADYAQPFPVLAIEFPPDYQSERIMPAIAVGAVTLMIDLALVGWCPEFNVVAIQLIASDEMTVVSKFQGCDGLSVEECLNREDVTRREATLYRMILNAAMSLSHFGHKECPLNAGQVDRLARRRDLCRRRGDPLGASQSERDLKLLPNILSFAQDVTLWDAPARLPSSGSAGSAEATDAELRAPVAPHWRRGHWTRQACGPKWSQRKRVFRRPCLVQAGRLEGSPALSTSTYQIGERS